MMKHTEKDKDKLRPEHALQEFPKYPVYGQHSEPV